MKPNRILSLLLAAALLISMFCTACTKKPSLETATDAPATEAPETVTDAPVTEEPMTEAPATEAPIDAPVRMRNGGKLSFLPDEPLSIPKLSEMVYDRPDTEKLIADIEALTGKVPECDDAEALLDEYYPIAEQISNFYSMDSLAFYHYTMDVSDSFYDAEYDYCEDQLTVATEKENALYAAFAASPCRDALEKAYFGEGFLLDYDDFNEADDTFFELKQQENDLLFQYYELSGEADLTDPREIERNHQAAGNIFIELVKVRQQIAAAKGYDNYMDYSYACDFKRDYTTDRAREYLDLVKTSLAPLMQNPDVAGRYADYSGFVEYKAMEMLSAAAEQMGGPIWDGFRFMSAYELCDVSYARNKMAIAYTSYLNNYEAPFVFVDPDSKDLIISLFHEFGHFTDWYYNYGIAGDYETGETYSQAMQYLAFKYAEPFTDNSRAANLRATLSDLLVYSVLQEGAYADFELQAYALAPEELTVERLDAIFGQCMKDYGISGLTGIRFQSNFWSVYMHFYSYPGYVISYSDSAVAAMQICRLESETPGAGVDAFCRLLERTHGKKFAAVLEEVGLDDPFEAATLEKTAEFLREAFDMD